MSQDLYRRLRKQLDQYSIGFPATESGVEIRILEKLFTEEEAEMFLNLTMKLESAQSVAQRIGKDPAEVSALLERMTDKGLVFRLRREEASRYAAAPFVVGIYEFQLNRLDSELAGLMERYFDEGFNAKMAGSLPPLRTVPVNRALDVSWPVAPYEDIKAIMKTKDKICVANCICRVHQGILEQGCDKPLEVCFSFGSHADYYVEKGMGRYISREEAMEILDRCDEAGLVPQPFNVKNPGGMCNCCGDCCGVLRGLKSHPAPARIATSSYYAAVDEDLCTACETCLDRCQMDAVAISERGVAQVNLDRCIGCGLCVTTCPTEAMSLERKPQGQESPVPENPVELMMKVAQQRGADLTPFAFAKPKES